MTMVHEEGVIPHTTLRFHSTEDPPFFVRIHHKEAGLIFQGYRTEKQTENMPGIWCVTYQSNIDEGSTAAATLRALCTPWYQPPHTHPFFSDEKEEQVLHTIPYSLYWDRCTGVMGLSHIFKGTDHKDISAIQDHNVLYVQKNITQRVNISLFAEWNQVVSGWCDVGPTIAAQFEKNMIHTLTPQSFEKHWPTTENSVGQSGYSILYSSLTRTKKNILKIFPENKPTQKYKPIVVTEQYFNASLIVGYYYRQKRRQNLYFTLTSGAFSDSAHHIEKHYTYRLGKITQYEDTPALTPHSTYMKGDKRMFEGEVYVSLCDSNEVRDVFIPDHNTAWKNITCIEKEALPLVEECFFSTPQGRHAYEHALARAKNILTWGSRYGYFTLRLPCNVGFPLTLNHTITFRHCGKLLTGKIIKIMYTHPGPVTITVACRAIQNTVSESAHNSSYHVPITSPQESSMKEILKAPLRSVRVNNGPKAQQQTIREIIKNLPRSSLSKITLESTALDLDFHSLQGTDTIESSVELKTFPWYAKD